MSSREAELLLAVDRGGAESLQSQIEAQLRQAIRSGSLRPGSELPSTRALSHDLGVSRPLVMEAYAHLVAFDEARSGFAHLHPMEIDLAQRPNATKPELSFKITIPKSGRYVIWAQVNLGGHEMFVPFWFDVV